MTFFFTLTKLNIRFQLRIGLFVFYWLRIFESPKIFNSIQQGFGSGSAWIRINLSCWIRIRIQIADPDPGGQKWPRKIEKKSRIFLFLVLFGGLKASPVAWASFMEA